MSAKPEDFTLPDPHVAREVFAAASELAQKVQADGGCTQPQYEAASRVVDALFKAAHPRPRDLSNEAKLMQLSECAGALARACLDCSSHKQFRKQLAQRVISVIENQSADGARVVWTNAVVAETMKDPMDAYVRREAAQLTDGYIKLLRASAGDLARETTALIDQILAFGAVVPGPAKRAAERVEEILAPPTGYERWRFGR